MAKQEILEQGPVEAFAGGGSLGDGVDRGQLQHEGDIAELEVGIDQNDRLDRPFGQGHGQVDGHHRLTGTALGAEDRDDPALRAGGGGGRRAREW